MRFYLEIDRLQHPQAKLIPSALWHSRLFNRELADSVLTLMQLPGEDLIEYLQSNPQALPNKQQRKCAWLAIALSHPQLSDEALRRIANLCGYYLG